MDLMHLKEPVEENQTEEEAQAQVLEPPRINID